MRTLTKKEVCARLGIALSTLNNKIDPKSAWHDPSFPEKIMVGRMVRFSEDRLTAWVEQKSSKAVLHQVATEVGAQGGGNGVRSSAVDVTGERTSVELLAHPLRSQAASSNEGAPAKRAVPESSPAPFESDACLSTTSDMEEPMASLHGTEVLELYIDSPPPLTLWDLIESKVKPGRARRIGPSWASSLNTLLKTVAGSGTTVSQSGMLGSDEINKLLNPPSKDSDVLDAIDLHSHRDQGVFLTAVLYDCPDQCARLVRLAEALGVELPAAELLRSQREKLFALYESRESRDRGGIPSWRRLGERMRIVRE